MTDRELLIGIQENLNTVLASVNAHLLVNRPDPDQVRFASRNELILTVGSKEIGVKEISGSKHNERVVQYHKYASKSNKVEQPDETPWCSSYVCFVVENCFTEDGKPMGSTNSMTARSWLKWGESKIKDPLPGDIVVYWRGSKNGWQGHVGILLRVNADGSLVTLGGNQRDEVNVTTYSRSKLLDIRRSSKSRDLDAGDRERLYDIAKDIIDGKPVAIGGSLT